MYRRNFCLLTSGGIFSLAGCGGLSDGDEMEDDSPENNEDETELDNSSNTNEADRKQPNDEANVQYDDSIDSEQIMLSIEGVPDGFDYLDEEVTNVEDTSESNRELLKQHGIILHHSRMFIGESSSEQEGGYLTSEVEVHESVESAQNKMRADLESTQ